MLSPWPHPPQLSNSYQDKALSLLCLPLSCVSARQITQSVSHHQSALFAQFCCSISCFIQSACIYVPCVLFLPAHFYWTPSLLGLPGRAVDLTLLFLQASCRFSPHLFPGDLLASLQLHSSPSPQLLVLIHSVLLFSRSSPKLRWPSSCIFVPGQRQPPAADLWGCFAIIAAPQAISSSCPSSTCPRWAMHRHYPNTGDQVLAAVNPHPMSPNLRTAEEVFSADSPVWRPALGWDFLSFSPLQAPHYGALGCSRKAFPNGSYCCLPARSGRGRCCGVGVGTGMRFPVQHGWTRGCDLELWFRAIHHC